jgi:hypothetical protein
MLGVGYLIPDVRSLDIQYQHLRVSSCVIHQAFSKSPIDRATTRKISTSRYSEQGEESRGEASQRFLAPR